MSDDCGICCSPYTKTTRKMVECNNCNYQACSKCVQYYILHTNSEVKCMNCNVAWSMNFLFENFSKKFCVDYRHHRREILWNKQLYHLPVISEYLEQAKTCERLEEGCIAISRSLEDKKREYNSLKGKRGKKITERRIKIREEQHRLRETHYLTKQQKWNTSHAKYRIQENFYGGINKEAKRVANRPCITENCKGFINCKGECPICNTVVCIDCNVFKEGDNHECKQDDIETFKELSRSTRPCPKCNVRIHKINGCDQMWCINCNTAFSWTRGTIEQGRIHNPHYFDWLFNGGNQEDNNVEMMENDMCNEEILPHINQLRNYIRDTAPSQLDEDQKKTVLELYRKLEHNVSIDLVRYRTIANGEKVNVFQNLISYIKNQGEPAKNFESFTMKQDLYNEMYTILNNYKRNQIHLFRALFSKNIELQPFFETYNQNKTIFKECIQNFKKFYKKDYKVCI